MANKEFKKIDILHLFWLSPRNLIFSKIYKTLNPHGIVYIKGDLNTIPVSKGIKGKIRDWLYKSIDILSVETTKVYDGIINGLSGNNLQKKVLHVPNGIDDELIRVSGVLKKTFEQKDNLIITVGRIGTKQKNNEMLLEAIAKCGLKDWHVSIIGPIEPAFQQYISDFFDKYPHLKHHIEFTGPIYDKYLLWDYYNRAKIFCLTSIFEGMANVLSEALSFGNYIITTPVSGTEEYVSSREFGQFVDIGDTSQLSCAIQQIIDDDSILRTSVQKAHYKSETEFNWTTLLRPVAKRIQEIRSDIITTSEKHP